MSIPTNDRIEDGVRVIRYKGDGTVKWREDCEYCNRLVTREDKFRIADPATGFFPDHQAMRGCRSGGRDHCTCDGCF